MKNEDVGVIVGRFQVHELHEAHRALIDRVVSENDKVLVFIGLSPLRGTTKNPLDFNSRRRMFQETYPEIEVYYVDDMREDTAWSAALDAQIQKWTKPHQTVTLYGSRDSFIPHYSGKYPVKELETATYVSGTEIRRRIANSFPSTPASRAGAIGASFNRYPTVYTTVDIAVIDHDRKLLLLAKKRHETALRFIGGFADPTSPTFEYDARREVVEETGGISVDDFKYLGSTLIDDWRYRNEVDKIKTLFFTCFYVSGRPVGSDDVELVQWVSLDDFLADKIAIVKEHQPLVQMLKSHLTNLS